MKNILAILLVIIVIAACEKEIDPIEQPIIPEDTTHYALTQPQIEDSIIQKYIADSNLLAQAGIDGLYYVIENQGSGNSPDSTSKVTVVYKGYFIDEFVFDESFEPISFYLSSLILGWQQGLTYFKEGAKGTLIIPSHLAYGGTGISPNIPPNTILIFDISLIEVE